MDIEEELKVLCRKLSETEARTTSRLLAIAKEMLPGEWYDRLVDRMGKSESLDLLEMERNISFSAKVKVDTLTDILGASKNFRAAFEQFSHIENSPYEHPLEEYEEVHRDMVIAREKLFSLITEYEIREKVAINIPT